jgi:hypothetical protein
MKKVFKVAAIAFLSLPVFAQAAVNGSYTTGGEDAFGVGKRVATEIGQIVGILIPIMFALAILAFFWGIFRYVFGQSGESKVNGRKVMLWSLIAIFVMVSLYGIINLFGNTLGVNKTGNFTVPSIQ